MFVNKKHNMLQQLWCIEIAISLVSYTQNMKKTL